ncbi:MAG: response regulator [Candidatus Staskawiczbacteria bacterium]|nr:response regulator [Candidatus Staskawiczbacteria bacterium]
MNQTPTKKILIVEDNKDFLWILRQSFDNENVSVVYATDGQEGLDMAQKEKPDLIIMDILLPKMDGISIARKLKEAGVNAKMIFLTGFKDSEHISDAIDAFSDADYIVKTDMRIDDIVARVKDKLGIV